MLFGHFSVFLTQIGIAVLIKLDKKVYLFIMVNIQAFVFYISNQTLAFLYCNEISTDVVMATVYVVMGVILFFQSTFFFDQLNLLTYEGYFYMYAVFALAGFVFTLLFCGETKGLIEKEKKELFYPGAKWGRKLKDGEGC